MSLNIKIKGCGFTSYETVNLPTTNVENGTMIFDKTQGKPLYYSDGHWYRFSDDGRVHDVPVQVYLIAGQSNAVGYGDIGDLTDVQRELTGELTGV